MREVRLVAWVLLWSCIILALSNTDADASSCFGLESKSVRYAADRHIEVDTLWSLPFPTSATIAAKAWMNGKLVINDRYVDNIDSRYEHDMAIYSAKKPTSFRYAITIKANGCTRTATGGLK